MRKKLSTADCLLENKNGYVALISVLIISAVGLSVAVSLVLLSVGSSRSSLVLEQSNEALALSNVCAEEALGQIWDDDTFIGSDGLTLGQGSCTYAVTNSSVPKTIMAVGTVGTIVRRISITINTVSPYIHPSSWQEVVN